ncbi:E3 ubiquitin ligase BIG BROTHER-related-like [Lolium rigidum]|uniref:E3 ubiquitin ligase BIG BROTHER-related-like n=1 Tax=Lolium rigidum TaxID=89674 RepID=UPI001F5CDA07|nr:E3 ubiquitin ligase BIG BROTHER-related-like [Lolium rigidum]
MDASSKATAAAAAAGDGGEKPSDDQNLSPNTPAATGGGDDVSAVAAAAAGGRRPFTALSQEEADLALARVLQEQERAYMMLTGHGGDGSEYAGSDAGSYDDYEDEDEEGSEWEEEGDGVVPDGDGEDEEVGDADGAEVDPAAYDDDDAYARALQDAEEREVAQRLMALAGITDLGEEMDHDVEDGEDGDSAQDAWEDVDPDEYSYEELVALGEVVGTESRGVSADTLASLPSVTYQAQDKQDSNIEQCVICRVEFEEGESLIALPCKHSYHSECINQWLQLNKVCPMCSAEVPTSESNQA